MTIGNWNKFRTVRNDVYAENLHYLLRLLIVRKRQILIRRIILKVMHISTESTKSKIIGTKLRILAC